MSKQDDNGPAVPEDPRQEPDGDRTEGDETVADPSNEEVEESPPRRRLDPVRLITVAVLIVCIALFAWYLFSDRFTPTTDQARIEGFIVPVVPQVSGYLVDISVDLHDRVRAGQVLAQIDREPFELAVRSARAALANAGQQVGAQTAGIEAAAGKVGIAEARLDRSQRYYDRVQRVFERNPGALSQADRDNADASLAQAESNLISSEAQLERAKVELGSTGADNPMIETAAAALATAEFNLSQTTVIAWADGAVDSLALDVGHFAQAGQPIMSFVSDRGLWISAHLRENSLSHIEPGLPVDLVLDVAPGRIFSATVRSVGVGVSTGGSSNRGELPVVEGAQGWLRDPQRFPVILTVDEEDAAGLLRIGGQATVVIYTGDHPLLNRLARFRIWLESWLSYVR